MEALEILPIDCWKSIFESLDDDGLEAASSVCKDFLAISNIFKEYLQVTEAGIGMFSKLIKRFKQLKRIDLTRYKGDLQEAISEIAHSDLSLDVLDIRHDIIYKLDILKELVSNSKVRNLKALNNKLRLNDNGVVVIANLFPNLEQLKISNELCVFPHHGTGDYGIEVMASKLKFLTKFHISGAQRISDQSIVALSLNCVFLKAVTIHRCEYDVLRKYGATEKGIGLLLRNRPNLEALSIAGIIRNSESTITIENSIGHAKALTSLKILRMDVTDMLLNSIAEAKLPLKKLVMGSCECTVTALLKVLSNNLNKLRILRADFLYEDIKVLLNGDVGKLTFIDISDSMVTSSSIFLLSIQCPSLAEIKMNGTSFELDRDNYVPLVKNHKIQNINLAHCEIVDELIKQLSLVFPNLRVLDLSYCDDLTSATIEAIFKNCKFIRKLVLTGYRHKKLVKENSDFPEMIHLADLILSCSRIDDKGLSAIAEKCTRLVSLDLDSCNKVTKEGIKQILKNITTLKYMQIRSTDAGDLLEWMLSTRNFASLKKMYLVGFNEEQREIFLRHGCLLLS